MSLIKEEWKPIPDIEGLEVSSHGRIRSYHNNRWGLTDTPHLLSLTTNKGYKFFNYKNKKYSVHRSVCLVFNENPHNYPMVLHKDSKRDNNHYTNLKWGTGSQNTRQGVEEGSINPQEGYKVRLETLPTFILISPEGTPTPVKNLQQWTIDTFGIKTGNIYSVVRGKKRSYKGWTCQVCPVVV